MTTDPRSFPEEAQHLAALVEHAVALHESNGWGGPEHSTVDCAMWAIGQFQAAHDAALTVEVVTDAIACTLSVRAYLVTPDADPEDADPEDADPEHAEHTDEVFALLRGYLTGHSDESSAGDEPSQHQNT